MKLPTWQFITQGPSPQAHFALAKAAVEAGCPWVQLRMKATPQAVLLQTAQALLPICRENGARLTLNDDAATAKAIATDGVHLGLQDTPPGKVRKFWPDCYVMGGTANTWEQVQYMYRQGVDYIGLGPFRFTATKEKLSPVLGLAGYAAILREMEAADMVLPVFAIGGIEMEDIQALLETGVHGVAVSGMLAHAPNIARAVKALNETLGKNQSIG